MPAISFSDLLSHLRATNQGVAAEQWSELAAAVSAYESKTIDKKKCVDKFNEVVGNDALKAALKAASTGAAAAA